MLASLTRGTNPEALGVVTEADQLASVAYAAAGVFHKCGLSRVAGLNRFPVQGVVR